MEKVMINDVELLVQVSHVGMVTFYKTDWYDVPMLGKRVYLEATYDPNDEYEWNGGFHTEGREITYHTYRNEHGDLVDVFDCLLGQLEEVLGRDYPLTCIGDGFSPPSECIDIPWENPWDDYKCEERVRR